MTTALPTQTTWSVNRLAARAVALHTRDQEPDDLLFHDEARQLLEMLGLVEPGGREILPDDIRPNVMVDLGKAPGGKNPDASSPLAFADHGRRPEGMTTPPGLRDLPPLPAPSTPKRRRPPAKSVTPPVAAPVAARPRGKRPIPHGKPAGYFAHTRRKEPIPADDACGCRAAGSAYFRGRYRQQAS